MEFILDNGYKYELPKEKRILLFGANRTGKTLICKKIDNYYNNKKGYYSLLFNRDILSSNFISTGDDNTFTVTPFANEKKQLIKQIKEFQEEFNLDKLLKNTFDEKTASAYSYFDDIKKMFDNKYMEDAIGFENSFFMKNIFYTENYQFVKYYELDFIKKCIKKKSGNLRFLDLINKMHNDNIFEKVKNIDEIFSGLSPAEYQIKNKIIENKLNECPICYSIISKENKQKIIEDLNKVILNDDIKDSFNYYASLDDMFKNLFVLLVDNYDLNYKKIINDLNNSIMYYLILSIDLDQMNKLNYVIKNYKDINEKSQKFYLSQENNNSKIYLNIESEFKKFNEYTNSNFSFEIKEGKLKVIGEKKSIGDLSLSEQKLLQFIYFRILFLQHIEEEKDKIIITIDDPFDSYDDVYVYNMINIIFELIEMYNSFIDRFIVLSHSMNSLQLLNNEFVKKKFTFGFYWLDIFHNVEEISNIKDNFKIMQKMNQNISSFGLPIKLIEKMLDPYSLIVFSSILRENSDFNCYISKKTNLVVQKTLNIHYKYYNLISERINHDRRNLDISRLYKINEKLYGYTNYSSTFKSVRDVFDNIPEKYYDLELMQIKDKTIFKEKDLINLFVWKYLCVLKIRRILERKLFISLNRPKYKTLGDLIDLIDKEKPNKLYDFYLKYRNFLNSFNHSSSETIPPILIYHASYIYETLKEIEII